MANPITYYVEVRNKQQDFRGTKPTGIEKTVVTRYYTRFNPDPEDFLSLLDKPEWSGIETGKVRGTLKPISIQIQQGNWDVRIDWTEEWEEIDTDPDSEVILGIELYNVQRTYQLPQDRFKQINLSSRLWTQDENKTAHFQKLGRTRERVTITGTALGRVVYDDLLTAIKADENIVGCSLTYNRESQTTNVRIEMETDDG